jgi:hypothetical protein
MSNRVSDTISDETLSRIIHIESAGNPLAKATTSSATGLGQFLDATWLATVARHRPDWQEGKTRAQVLALRKVPKCAIEMLARFTEDNARALPGENDKEGDLYLAHFSGVGVAKRLLRAPAGAPCEDYFSPAAVRANRSILAGKTVGDVRTWAEQKMRKAGGRGWVEKYWDVDQATAPIRAAAVVPREARPDEEWTYDNPKPDRTGISESATVGTGLGITGTAYLIYEKITELPDRAWDIVAGLAAKPSFWFVVAVAAVFGFIWWKRRQIKREGLA